MAESEEELKSLLVKVKEESEKFGLKVNVQKTKIMASGPITSWEMDGETVGVYAPWKTEHNMKRMRNGSEENDSTPFQRNIYVWNLKCVLHFQFSSVQFSRSVVSDSLRPHESQHARPPCPSPTPGVHSDSRPSSR